MIRYIHGSENSIDKDVVYVFDKIPETIEECKKFCCAEPSENRNIITVEDGIVTGCFKGTVDELNNALLETYALHEQEYPLLITRRVPRVKELKYVRGIRAVLSHISRSQYRTEVKAALHSDWTTRLQTLLNVDLTRIDYSVLNKNMTGADIMKVIAFQLGQMFGLMLDKELYTKNSIGDAIKELKPFLDRSDISREMLNDLNGLKNYVCRTLLRTEFVEHSETNSVLFVDSNIEIELKNETIIN